MDTERVSRRLLNLRSPRSMLRRSY